MQRISELGKMQSAKQETANTTMNFAQRLFRQVELLVRRLRCEHEWLVNGSMLVDCGRNKLFWYKCQRCGKDKMKTAW
jgi:hypothetical protein